MLNSSQKYGPAVAGLDQRIPVMAHAFQSTGHVTSLPSPSPRLVGSVGRAMFGALSLASVLWKRVRGEVTVPPLSAEWLSAHEIDASKHSREA